MMCTTVYANKSLLKVCDLYCNIYFGNSYLVKIAKSEVIGYETGTYHNSIVKKQQNNAPVSGSHKTHKHNLQSIQHEILLISHNLNL